MYNVSELANFLKLSLGVCLSVCNTYQTWKTRTFCLRKQLQAPDQNLFYTISIYLKVRRCNFNKFSSEMYREQFNCNLYLFQFSLLHKPCLALPREPFSEVLNHFSVCLIWLCDKLGTKQKLIFTEHLLRHWADKASKIKISSSWIIQGKTIFHIFLISRKEIDVVRGKTS